MIKGLSNQDLDYYPLTVAASLANPDQDILQWLRRVAADRKQQWASRYGEDEASMLGPLLDHTSLDPAALQKIGIAFFETVRNGPRSRRDGRRATDELLALRFINAAERRAQAELADLVPGDPNGRPLIEVLKAIVEPLEDESQWETESRIYATLAKWEPEGSDGRCRARYRFAGMLFESGKNEQALQALDALIADVQKGVYLSANRKDIANLRWRICSAAGWIENGLDYFRTVADAARGTPDSFRLSAYFIDALAQVGRFDEAERRYRTMEYDASSPRDVAVRQQLLQRIAEAKATTRPS